MDKFLVFGGTAKSYESAVVSRSNTAIDDGQWADVMEFPWLAALMNEPGNCLDMLGVCQNDLKVTFQYVPHRLPINPRGFHRHVLYSKLAQPCNQFTEFACGGAKTANVLQRFAGLPSQNTSGDRGLMYIQSAALRMQELPWLSPSAV